MDNGWVCIHRKMLDWEWMDDHNTTRLFTFLLLMVNHKDKKWKGINISKGSFLTGRESLAKKTGLTVQQVRTSLNKLKSTSEITIKSTSKYSIISITNWDEYQDSNQQDNQQDNQQVTNNQPASNQQVTTTNNETIKQIKKRDKEAVISGRDEYQEKELKDVAKKPDDKLTLSELSKLKPENIDAELWMAFLSARKDRKTTQSSRAINAVIKQLEKCEEMDISGNSAIERFLEESWKTIKAEYLTPRNNSMSLINTQPSQQRYDRV